MKLVTRCFIFFEITIYILAIFLLDYSVSLRYLSIILCFIYCMIQMHSKDTTLLRISFILTLISDLFLLVINDYYQVGVFVFIFVQNIYLYRLINVNKIKYKLLYLLGLFILILNIIIFKVNEKFDILASLSIFYFLTLIFNVIISLKNYKTNPYFCVGLLLFLGCDIFVGLGNIHLYIMIPNFINKVLELNFDFQWFFYIPSQVLIALSINKNKHLN